MHHRTVLRTIFMISEREGMYADTIWEINGKHEMEFSFVALFQCVPGHKMQILVADV